MGRRPKADAIRRQNQAAHSVIATPVALPVPDAVLNNAAMLECWEWTVEGASHFRTEDIPQIVVLCSWWAIARQCMANLEARNGGIVTKVLTPMGERRDPDIGTLATATTQMRQIQSELGVSPLARTRMGLMKIAAASMASDLPAKVFKMLDEHHGD